MLADRRAGADIEPVAWRPDEVAEFGLAAERNPTTQAELFKRVPLMKCDRSSGELVEEVPVLDGGGDLDALPVECPLALAALEPGFEDDEISARRLDAGLVDDGGKRMHALINSGQREGVEPLDR